jgi:hypothetical protein
MRVILSIKKQFLDHLDATLAAKNQEMQFVMLNVKNPNAKLSAQIKLVKPKTALSV